MSITYMADNSFRGGTAYKMILFIQNKWLPSARQKKRGLDN